MARAPGPSLRWLTLAVLLPLLVLAVLAWLGNRAQVKAAWSNARDKAGHSARLEAERLGLSLLDRIEMIPVFTDPPHPGTPSPADATLDGSDPAALLELRDNPDAGTSPAGLPRRMLAALRLHALDPQAQLATDIARLATEEAPSILTITALQKIEPQESPFVPRWKRGQQALAILKQNPAIGSLPDGGWLRLGDDLWWLHQLDGQLRYIAPADTREALEKGQSLVSDWAALHISLDGRPLGPPPDPHHVLARAHVPLPGDLSVAIIADPRLLEAPARTQAGWNSALLAVALVVSLAGLLAIHRSVARERRLGELKSQFVSSVSHELRAPVGSIRLMAEALQAGKVDQPATFHSLIAREGERLSHLIENVLDFARIEEGRKRYRFEESNLAALLRDAIAPLEPPATEKNITIVTALADCTASVDPAAIQQALVNLLDNAIKFSPEGSEIRVSLSSEADTWSLSVADQGPGIPASEHRRIFERFHRLGDEMRRETQGTGIGLSIVQHITDAHRGRIRLTSEPGKGSTFTLSFPQTKP